jgi:hypothetical protein
MNRAATAASIRNLGCIKKLRRSRARSRNLLSQLHELQFTRGEDYHIQKQPAMFPPVDIRFSVHSFLVADWYVLDPKIQFAGAE